jgi:hypothetical protein
VSGGELAAHPKGQEPAVGTKVELRLCDWIAFSVSKTKQIPFFDPLAQVEKRDEAIKQAKALLLKSPVPVDNPELRDLSGRRQ